MGQFEIGMLVKSKTGHDQDKIYVIMDIQSEYLYLVDGRIRTLAKPKKKKKKHVQPIHIIDHNIAEKLSTNTVIDEEIKYAIKLYESDKKVVIN